MENILFLTNVFTIILRVTTAQDDLETLLPDPNGYLFFCLCMGRLGNQLEHFLGGLRFAKEINRTLVLPPFRSYVSNRNVHFEDWFEVKPLLKYHRVITAKKFMSHLADKIWPPEKRFGFCYQLPEHPPCEVKMGNPFANFWDDLDIDFVKTMGYNISYMEPHLWNERFPPSKFPVIAMKGAPAAFPMAERDLLLQKFTVFSQSVFLKVEELLKLHFNGSTDYIGIHLRNGIDWKRACAIIKDAPRFMASYQCAGFDYSKVVTEDMCFPPVSEVIRNTQMVLKSSKDIKGVLVATDNDPLLSKLRQELPTDIKVVHVNPDEPIIDAALLAFSQHFIGNCVSSFSAFVWRYRQSHSIGPTSYFDLDEGYETKTEL